MLQMLELFHQQLLFAAILASFTLRKHTITGPFILGFIISMIGIIFIALEESNLNINPKGDILALGAAILWAVYAVVLKKYVHLDMI